MRGRPLCLAYGDLIDHIAESSEDYADFIGKLNASVEFAERLGSQAPFMVDQRFNEQSAANGADNYRHFAGALYWGTPAAAVAATFDFGEVIVRGEAERPENWAEVYGDIAGAAANLSLSNCVYWTSPWYMVSAFDNAAWARCRHLPGALWRYLFCKLWG
jgi:hypothetical protein